MEKSLLADWWGLRDDETIARDLGRSVEGVRKMAREIFGRQRRSGPWTSAEVARLKKYLGATNLEAIALILGRDAREVEQQIFELGRIQQSRHWSRKEVAELKRLYGTRTDEALAKIFGRSVETLKRQARSLRLAKDKAFLRRLEGQGASRMPRWSDAEIGQLRELYASTSNLEIAVVLNRSVKSVVSKAHHMGLKKGKQRLQEMGRENVSLRYQGDDEI